MELMSDNLQTLIDKAWALHDKLSHEIKNTVSVCKVCSQNGRYCDIGDTPFQDRAKLIAIRDALKELEEMLLNLRKLQSWQLIERNAALSHFEESRLNLIEQVTNYRGRGLGVVKELNAFVGNPKAAFNSKKKVKKNGGQSGKRRLFGFLIHCVRTLFDPWKWYFAAGFAIKCIVVSASVSSAIQFYCARKQSRSSERRILPILDSTGGGSIDSVLAMSKGPIDVFDGRG